jgi:hypothetical protein
MDTRTHKTYAGSQVLAALVFLQVASIPQFVNGPEMLHFATHALFVYEVVLIFLIFVLTFCGRQQPIVLPARPWEISKPRLLTLTNGLTTLLLTVSVWAAWKAGYRFGLMVAGTGLLLTLTLLLHRRNLRHWKNFVQNNRADA